MNSRRKLIEKISSRNPAGSSAAEPLGAVIEPTVEDDPVEDSEYMSHVKEKFETRIRKLVRNILLTEGEMLKILDNPYEDLSDFNRIANYALRDDIEGALNDPELPTKDLYWILDEMMGWPDRVGSDEPWFTEDSVVPDNWDAEKVYDFMERLESAAQAKVEEEYTAASAEAPDLEEREALAAAFTMDVILPDDIKHITYQIRRKAGKPKWVMLEDHDGELGHMATSLGADELRQYGTTIDDLIRVLEDGGARLRKKQKPSKPMMPYYD